MYAPTEVTLRRSESREAVMSHYHPRIGVTRFQARSTSVRRQ